MPNSTQLDLGHSGGAGSEQGSGLPSQLPARCSKEVVRAYKQGINYTSLDPTSIINSLLLQLPCWLEEENQ